MDTEIPLPQGNITGQNEYVVYNAYRIMPQYVLMYTYKECTPTGYRRQRKVVSPTTTSTNASRAAGLGTTTHQTLPPLVRQTGGCMICHRGPTTTCRCGLINNRCLFCSNVPPKCTCPTLKIYNVQNQRVEEIPYRCIPVSFKIIARMTPQSTVGINIGAPSTQGIGSASGPLSTQCSGASSSQGSGPLSIQCSGAPSAHGIGVPSTQLQDIGALSTQCSGASSSQGSGNTSSFQSSNTQGVSQSSNTQGASQSSNTQGASQSSNTQGASQSSNTQGAPQTSNTQGVSQSSNTSTPITAGSVHIQQSTGSPHITQGTAATIPSQHTISVSGNSNATNTIVRRSSRIAGNSSTMNAIIRRSSRITGNSSTTNTLVQRSPSNRSTTNTIIRRSSRIAAKMAKKNEV